MVICPPQARSHTGQHLEQLGLDVEKGRIAQAKKWKAILLQSLNTEGLDRCLQ